MTEDPLDPRHGSSPGKRMGDLDHSRIIGWLTHERYMMYTQFPG